MIIIAYSCFYRNSNYDNLHFLIISKQVVIEFADTKPIHEFIEHDVDEKFENIIIQSMGLGRKKQR